MQAPGPIPGQYHDRRTWSCSPAELDYQIYAPGIYGIDTNNGGITITGDSDRQPGNRSYSVMYQDPWTPSVRRTTCGT